MGIAADISLIVVIGLVLGAIAHRLGQPVLLGYIATGILLGPHTGGLQISDAHDIELLAEIGVALLLFAIGIEFSLGSLRSVQRVALFGTAIQMALTLGFGMALGHYLGWGRAESIWFGCMISVSSTMVVLKVLATGGFMSTLSARVMLGMLIVQDLAVIPMMIVLPQLSQPTIDPVAVAWAIGRSLFLLALLAFVALRTLPRVMHLVASWNSRELFILTVVSLGLGIGYLSHLFGLSYALGAFIAGLVLSQSEYGHQALSDIIPLRDVFGLLFFASVGILLDPDYLVRNAVQVSTVVAVVILLKGMVFASITRVFGYRNIVPVAAGLGLSQIGEFSFLLAQLGINTESIGEDVYALTISTAVVTMLLTPYLARSASPLYRLELRLRRKTPVHDRVGPVPETVRPVIIAGAGRVGRSVAEVLATSDLPFCLIDLDSRRVAEARGRGWPVMYGDASQELVLEAAGLRRAPLVIVTLPSTVASLAVSTQAHALAPGVHLVVRADSLEAVAELITAGAHRVVQPEFEAALEMSRQALLHLQVEPTTIQEQLASHRLQHYREASAGYSK